MYNYTAKKSTLKTSKDAFVKGGSFEEFQLLCVITRHYRYVR